MRLRLVLGVVYAGMAVGQLLSWTRMLHILPADHVGGVPAMRWLAAVLLAGELVAGVWFLVRPRSRAAVPVGVYTVVSLLWAALAATRPR